MRERFERRRISFFLVITKMVVLGVDVRGSWKLVWAKLSITWIFEAWLANDFHTYEARAAKELL